MKKIVLSILSILVFNVGFAQKLDTLNQSFHNRSFGMYLVFPKLELSSLSNLNPLLTEYGYPTLPRQTFNWGIGLQYRLGHLLVNLDAMITQQQRENVALGTKFRRLITSTNFNIAYYMYKSKVGKGNMAIYPFTGLSTNETNLYLSKATSNQAITQLLIAPNNTSQMEHFAVGINIGVGIDITNLHSKNLFLTGLRVGYRFSPEGASTWESSFTNITNAPSDSFEHFFIQFNFGGGYNWKKGGF